MSKMIQIRNVPDGLHRKLRARAARAGMSLSDYLLLEIRKTAELPTLEEFHTLLGRREAVKDDLHIVRILRDEREAH